MKSLVAVKSVVSLLGVEREEDATSDYSIVFTCLENLDEEESPSR